MVFTIFISSLIFWVNANSCNVPLCWDPITRAWKINQDPAASVVYVMPDASQVLCGSSQMKPNSGSVTTNQPTLTTKCEDSFVDLEEFERCRKCCKNSEELIVFDTDGDPDDAMALMMLVNGVQGKPAMTVAGITCTNGCSSATNAVKNVIKTLMVCNALGKIPVYTSHTKQGLVNPIDAISPYGNDSFGDFYFYFNEDDENVQDLHPAIFISNLVRENPGKVKIVCTGPLTNLAIATHLCPDLYRIVDQIYYVGGSEHGSGTHAGRAAWNDHLDPFASRAIFNYNPEGKYKNGPKITIFPEELCAKPLAGRAWRDKLSKKGTKLTKLLDLAERKMEHGDEWKCGGPILAAALIGSKKIESKDITGYCKVDDSGMMEVVEDTENPHNVRVITAVHKDRVLDIIYDCL